MTNGVIVAREAIQRHDWAEAREAYHAADRQSDLGPEDLERLADASWWAGYPDEATEAYERAYAGYAEAQEHGAAAYVAAQLAYLAFRRASFAVGSGWMGKAEEALKDNPDAREHAWLKLLQAAGIAFSDRDREAALVILEDAIELAGERDVPEVHAMATSLKGYAMIGAGSWQEGMACIDEAAAAAVSGRLELRTACDVYCNTIAACRNMADYGRAGEWTEEAERWMQRNSLGGYPGICRVHRAELKKLHGSYAEAEQEARAAREELERHRLMDAVGSTYKEVGDVRLRRGDLDAAEEAYSKAYEYGSSTQPGTALLHLARGDAERAAESITSALAASPNPDSADAAIQLSRSRLLPAQIAISLARDDLASAQVAAGEMEEIAERFDRPAFQAAALTGRGEVDLAEGRSSEAAITLDGAWRLWRDIDLPYESAQARVLLGRAKAAAGAESAAQMDWSAARAGFERIGAARDVQEVDALLGAAVAPMSDEGRRVIRTFMFTDIVTSTDLIGLIGDDAWEDLLRWHDRALRSEFGRHRGHEVRHTGDGFFVSFEQASDGVETAVAIQRRLDAHRREHGFAPWVRIGLHTAEATPQVGDYAGQGVHVAARVGDIGEREEIVISADALEQAGTIRFPLSNQRTVTLKGVLEPVDVHTIDWR